MAAKYGKTDEKKDSKAEEVRLWHSLIKKASARMDQAAKDSKWEELIEASKGKFRISDVFSNFSIIIPPINLIHAYIRTEIPSLYLRDPHIEVVPKKGSSILSAKIRELAINYIWRTKNFKRETKKNIRDALVIGHSWFKSGYTGQFGVIEDENGRLTEYIDKEEFFGYRVPWKNVTFNSESIDPPHDARWMAHEILRPLEDVQANKRYKNTANLNGSPIIEGTQDLGSRRPVQSVTDGEVLWIRLWEIWDIVNQKVCTIAEGCDEYLEVKDWPYKLKGFPFKMLAFNEFNDQAYAVSDVFMFYSQVLELIKIRAMQLDHLKRFNRQYETEKGNLDDEAKTTLSLGLAGGVIEVNAIGKIQPISYPPIQADVYAIEERVKEDMVNVSGQSPLERGASQKTTTRTVGELMAVQRGAQNRRSERVDMVEDFFEAVSRDQISLLMQFADLPFYVKLTGKEPQELIDMLRGRPSAQDIGAVTDNEGFTFTKEDIQGEFDVDIKAGSTIPMDRENYMQILLQVLELAQKVGAIPGGPLVGAIGKAIVGELDAPVIEQAFEAEIQMQQKMKQEAEAMAAQQQQVQAAQFGAEKQLEAEKIQSKNTGDLLRVASTIINANGGDQGQPSN